MTPSHYNYLDIVLSHIEARKTKNVQALKIGLPKIIVTADSHAQWQPANTEGRLYIFYFFPYFVFERIIQVLK